MENEIEMENELNIIDQNFQEAVRNINNLNYKPSDDELLKLYGLYKQSLFGDNNTEKPGFFHFRANKKWNTWVDGDGPIMVDCVTMLHISGTLDNDC